MHRPICVLTQAIAILVLSPQCGLHIFKLVAAYPSAGMTTGSSKSNLFQCVMTPFRAPIILSRCKSLYFSLKFPSCSKSLPEESHLERVDQLSENQPDCQLPYLEECLHCSAASPKNR